MPGSPGGQGIAVIGRTQAVEPLAERHVDLVDAPPWIGDIAVGPEADAAQAIVVERRFENIAGAVVGEEQTREGEVMLAGADRRIAQSAVKIEGPGLEIEGFELLRTGLSEAVAGIDEGRQSFAGEHLAIVAGDVIEFLRRYRIRISYGERVVLAEHVVHGGGGEVFSGPRAGVPRLSRCTRASTGL